MGGGDVVSIARDQGIALDVDQERVAVAFAEIGKARLDDLQADLIADCGRELLRELVIASTEVPDLRRDAAHDVLRVEPAVGHPFLQPGPAVRGVQPSELTFAVQ